jgi:acetoin utilization protein AcuB
MVVHIWMSKTPVTVPPATSISDAAIRMARDRLRHLLVVEHRPRQPPLLLGIVSAHDVARAYPPDLNPFSVEAWDQPIERPVADIMTPKTVTVTPNTPIEKAAQLLRDHKIGALPVVDVAGLAGIITESDVLAALGEIVGSDAGGVRITFDISDDEDTIAAVVTLANRYGLRLASVLTMVHKERRLCTVRVAGQQTQAFVDALWASHHVVLSVEGPCGNRSAPTRPRVLAG